MSAILWVLKKKQEQFENLVWYPLSTDECGAAEY